MIKEVKNISWAYDLPESRIHLACRSLDGFCEGWRDSTDLVINHGQYVYIKMGEVFNKIGKANYEAILLNHNGNANIYKDIKHITFTTLKFVDLSHNRLTSIEGICHLSMASLEIINLSSNNIVSIKSVVKIKSEKMRKVLLECNRITETKDVFKLDCSNLTALNLDYHTNQSIFDYVKIGGSQNRKISLQSKWADESNIGWRVVKNVRGKISHKFWW